MLTPRPSHSVQAPKRRIEREEPRFHLRHRNPALDTGQVPGEQQVLFPGDIHYHQPRGRLQRGLHRIGEAPPEAGTDHQPIDHDFDRMFSFFIQVDRVGQVLDFPVHPRPDEPLPGRFPELFPVRTFPAPHDRGQDLDLRPGRKIQHRVHDLLHRLGADRFAALVAMGRADPREQQTEIIVNLGYRADGGAGIAGSGFLLDGDGGRQPFNRLHVRLFHLLQELPGVGGKGLHVPALSFGVQGVERQRRFPRTGHTGNHDQPVPRKSQVDPLQVVLRSSADNDFLRGHLPPLAAENIEFTTKLPGTATVVFPGSGQASRAPCSLAYPTAPHRPRAPRSS